MLSDFLEFKGIITGGKAPDFAHLIRGEFQRIALRRQTCRNFAHSLPVFPMREKRNFSRLGVSSFSRFFPSLSYFQREKGREEKEKKVRRKGGKGSCFCRSHCSVCDRSVRGEHPRVLLFSWFAQSKHNCTCQAKDK